MEGLCDSHGSDNGCKQEFSQNIRRKEDNMNNVKNLWVPENVTEI